jgi:hypothetical protein
LISRSLAITLLINSLILLIYQLFTQWLQ